MTKLQSEHICRYWGLYHPTVFLVLLSLATHILVWRVFPEWGSSVESLFGLLLVAGYAYLLNTLFIIAQNLFVRFLAILLLISAATLSFIDMFVLVKMRHRIDFSTLKVLAHEHIILAFIVFVVLIVIAISYITKISYCKNKLIKLSIIPVTVALIQIGTTPFPNALKKINDWDKFREQIFVYFAVTPELPAFLRLSIKNSKLLIFNPVYFYKNSHFFKNNLNEFKDYCKKIKSEDVNFGNKIFSHGAFEQKYRPGVGRNSRQYYKQALKNGFAGIETDVFYLDDTGQIVISHDFPLKTEKPIFFKDLLEMLNGNNQIKLWIDVKNRIAWDIKGFIKRLKSLNIPAKLLNNIYFEHPNPFVLHRLAKNGFNTIYAISYGVPYITMPYENIKSYIPFTGCKGITLRWESVDPSLSEKLDGFPVFTYTLDNKKAIQNLYRQKFVKVIITDLPHP